MTMATTKNLAAGLIPQDLKLNDIFCDNDFNCRGVITPIDVVPLSQSIDKMGLQQAIIVQPWTEMAGKKFRIISGHRRFMAFKILERETIPAVVMGHMDELAARALNLEENLKRKDLNMVQEAKALEPFTYGGWTAEQIAQEFSQPIPWVRTRLNLLKLPTDIQEKIAAGILTQEQVKQISSMKSKDNQYAAVKKIIEHKERGEKKKLELTQKKVKPMTKRRRDPTEIFRLMDIIQKHVGNSFVTRALSWAAGELNDLELHRSLQEYCKEKGVIYHMPQELKEAAAKLQ